MGHPKGRLSTFLLSIIFLGKYIPGPGGGGIHTGGWSIYLIPQPKNEFLKQNYYRDLATSVVVISMDESDTHTHT